MKKLFAKYLFFDIINLQIFKRRFHEKFFSCSNERSVRTFFNCVRGGGSDKKPAEDNKVTEARFLGASNTNFTAQGGEAILQVNATNKDGKVINQAIDKSKIEVKNVQVSEYKDLNRANAKYVTVEVLANTFKTQQAKDIVIDIDASGSMATNDEDNKRIDAAKKFVDIGLTSNDNTAVVQFSNDTTILSNFTKDKKALKDAISKVGKDGYTYMYSSIKQINEHMLKDANGSKKIILLTDGQANDRYYHDEVIKASNDLNTSIYIIALGDFNFSNLEEIANKTGGIFTKINTADGLNKVFSNFAIALSQASQNIKIKIDWTNVLQPFQKGTQIKITGDLIIDGKTTKFEIITTVN